MISQAPKPYFDKRPWGNELWLTKDHEAPSMVKILTVNPHEVLSLQYHTNRDEFWHVISGTGMAVIGEKRIPLNPGDNQFVPRETHHSLEGGTSTLVVVELAFGDFDEGDITRLNDRYGRS
jgi:mannose-6-phosphate isomerase-like protein (cupin superfamily)